MNCVNFYEELRSVKDMASIDLVVASWIVVLLLLDFGLLLVLLFRFLLFG